MQLALQSAVIEANGFFVSASRKSPSNLGRNKINFIYRHDVRAEVYELRLEESALTLVIIRSCFLSVCALQHVRQGSYFM